MTIDHQQGAGGNAQLEAGTTITTETTHDLREWILAAAVFSLLLVEGVRNGGFWPAEALVGAIASLVVLVVGMVLVPPDRRSRLLVGGVMTLALWWLVRAIGAETLRNFLPLGASMLGFAAAFVAVRPLVGRARELAGLALALPRCRRALVGFAGLVWRWYPMAIPAQGLWRISTTLTYSDAAGLVLAVCLCVALGVNLCPPLVRVTVCLCAGGLLATQSRGACVAFACACLLVPWRRYVDFAVPLAAGAVLGVAAIATSPDSAGVPWLAAVVVAASAISAAGSREIGSFIASSSFGSSWAPARTHVNAVVAATGAAVVIAAAIVGLHHEIGLRALSPSDLDRRNEWSAAIHQWWSAPIVGVGPDRLLYLPRRGRDLRPFRPQRVPAARRRRRCRRSGAVGTQRACRCPRRPPLRRALFLCRRGAGLLGGRRGIRFRLAPLRGRAPGGMLRWASRRIDGPPAIDGSTATAALTAHGP